MRGTCQKLRLRAESLTTDRVGVGLVPTPGAAPTPETRSVQGLVLVRVPRYPARLYGVRLSVTAKLETPSIFKGFSYIDYPARQGVCSLLRRARVELIETDQGGPFWAVLYAFKTRVGETIAQTCPSPTPAC